MKTYKEYLLIEGFDKIANGNYIGYKVMRYDNGKIIAGANSRLNFPLKKNSTISMGGNGIYLSNDKEYVLSYYSGLADKEVLLTLEFNYDNIINGINSFNDKEPEIGVSEVKIIDYEFLENDE